MNFQTDELESEHIAKPLDVQAIRADFPILHQTIHADRPLVYLDNAASTQHPRAVIESIENCYKQSYANVHRGIHWLSEQSTNNYEHARAAIAEFIGTQNDREVIFTSGTTHAINLVARSIGDTSDPSISVSADDEILLTEMEHHSNIVPWQQLAERTGATVRFVPMTDDGQLCMNSLSEMLNDKTKVFAFSAVSNVLGTINPVAKLVAMASQWGITTVVDAAQHVPHEPTDVTAWNADFVIFSGHKMLGPSGIGILHGKMEMLRAIPPFHGGGSMISKVTTEGYVPGEIPAKFEAGTPPIAQAIGLHAAVDYLNGIGLSQIKQHEQTLANLAIDKLQSEIDGIRILGPMGPGQRAGIVSFVVDGVSPQDISLLIDRHGIAIRAGHHCAMPLHEKLGINSSCRASFYLYNTVEEVDRFVEALAQTLQKLR